MKELQQMTYMELCNLEHEIPKLKEDALYRETQLELEEGTLFNGLSNETVSSIFKYCDGDLLKLSKCIKKLKIKGVLYLSEVVEDSKKSIVGWSFPDPCFNKEESK